jgi:DNA-nicking Smr family endonuclease
MDFDKILDQWETLKKQKSKGTSPRDTSRQMEEWLAYHPIENKDKLGNVTPAKHAAALRRKKLLEMEPESELDLHGLSVQEALRQLEVFMQECKTRGLKKVLIIHGKGNHSQRAPVLKKKVREFLETCPYAGECGTPDRYSGGSGALWVILK